MPVTIDGSNTPTAGGVGYGDGTELAFTSAGSAGQVLLSNGASAPSFGAVPTVNLATGVTGTLPIANGGTGTTSTQFANLATNVTGTLPIANGGTGTTSTQFANLATNVTGTLPVGNGGTGATTLTANNVLLGNGTSALQVVAPGSSGNVLTSNGTTWTSAAAPAGGSWIFIKSVTASSSATVDVEDNFNQYDMYAIIGTNISLSSGQEFSARIKIGGSYQTSNSYKTIVMYASNAGGTPTGDTITTYCPIVRGYIGASPESGSVVMYIPMPASTSLNKYFYFNAAGTTASTMGINIGASAWIPSSPVTTALQGIRFFISSSGTATITTGTFRLYGIKNS